MNVASLELCQELCRLSGWKDTDYTYYANAGQHSGTMMHRSLVFDKPDNLPAYDSGYLLRKLPARVQGSNGVWYALMGFPNGVNPWFAYENHGAVSGEDSRWPHDQEIPFYKRTFDGETPEDCLCRAAIELFKQGILTKETK